MNKGYNIALALLMTATSAGLQAEIMYVEGAHEGCSGPNEEYAGHVINGTNKVFNNYVINWRPIGTEKGATAPKNTLNKDKWTALRPGEQVHLGKRFNDITSIDIWVKETGTNKVKKHSLTVCKSADMENEMALSSNISFKKFVIMYNNEGKGSYYIVCE